MFPNSPGVINVFLIIRFPFSSKKKLTEILWKRHSLLERKHYSHLMERKSSHGNVNSWKLCRDTILMIGHNLLLNISCKREDLSMRWFHRESRFQYYMIVGESPSLRLTIMSWTHQWWNVMAGNIQHFPQTEKKCLWASNVGSQFPRP
jgi:hypothetical protein